MTIVEQAKKIIADMIAVTATLTDEQGLELIALFEPWKSTRHMQSVTDADTATNFINAYKRTHRSPTGRLMLHPHYGRASA